MSTLSQFAPFAAGGSIKTLQNGLINGTYIGGNTNGGPGYVSVTAAISAVTLAKSFTSFSGQASTSNLGGATSTAIPDATFDSTTQIRIGVAGGTASGWYLFGRWFVYEFN
jgi:hypothetical protein